MNMHDLITLRFQKCNHACSEEEKMNEQQMGSCLTLFRNETGV